jgi:hypothetical protein
MSKVGSWLGYTGSPLDELTVPAVALGTFRGSWLSHLDFVPVGCMHADDGAERLWAYDEVAPAWFEPIAQEQRLPNDCTFREDVRLLAAGDVAGAGAAKQRLEDQQRREHKLRGKKQ